MKTRHEIIFESSQDLRKIKTESIALVVTSPPYPMIQMWDEVFSILNKDIERALTEKNGIVAFQLMHKELKKVWEEIYRVLIPGGILCINIGDATRTIGEEFQLFPNHAIIIQQCNQIGFTSLPEIIWRKQTNAPNKFMGSGMLPPGAYVTLEHEYILIFRKGGKRLFEDNESKTARQDSGYFWEERNVWFSDLWDIKGTKQNMKNEITRQRSAAYPLEIPYRLINMFSIEDDIILDPFVGTGTTTLAAMISCRNSIGYELDPRFYTIIEENVKNTTEIGNQLIEKRINDHLNFVQKKFNIDKGSSNIDNNNELSTKYHNKNHNFPVVTCQEINLRLKRLKKIQKIEERIFEVEYE